jgi:DNA mismatch repair protein MutS
MYGYAKPTILKKDFGYVSVKQLRHPIVERLIDYEYVPHDIELGNDNLKGILLYGLNSSGKSTNMKAIGLGIIMAQSGMFVPAQKFTFSPYRSLYTRITGDDNIFRGLSSFTLEMVEVNAILKRADEHTLVIGDEVCRGTEHISGNAIVATTILKLAEAESSFIFATHLHEITTLQEIKKLNNVKAFHLNVSYDEKTKSLVYDRKMKEGSGEQIYGITVARYIIQDKDFIDQALKIKNELLDSHDTIISGKTSNYNKNVYVYECHLCGKKDKKSHLSTLETHHINFQKDCEKGLVKEKQHLKKNQEANLVVLCTECHDKIHEGKIKLNGYVMTSKGKSIVIKNED